MTWTEKLKAKLKDKGLPEYLSGVFRGSTDEDINAIIDGFGEIKADSPEFESTLNGVVQKSLDGSVDSRLRTALTKNENKLREMYDFVEKKAGTKSTTAITQTDPEPSGELTELKKLVTTLSHQVTALTVKGTKDQLVGSFLQKAKEEKKLPESWAKKYTHLIEKDDDVGLILGAAEKEYTEMTQLIINDKFGENIPPVRGGVSTTDSSIREYAEAKNANKSAGQIKGKEL